MKRRNYKKRTEDLLKHGHIYILAIVSIFLTLFFLKWFNSTPKFFVNFYGDSSYTSKLYLGDDLINYINKTLYSVTRLTQENRDFTSEYKDLKITGKSYIVYDVSYGKIISSKNENEVLPLASLTKVVSAITALKLADSNKDILIKKKLMRSDEVLDIGMVEGQRWKMQDLLKYALTISSNSSMDIIAGTVSPTNSDFVKNMNQYVKDLGFNNFTFNSASGLDYGSIIGGKGTALEYAKLFAESYKLAPEIFSYTTNSKIELLSGNNKQYKVYNTNKITNNIIGLESSKTGFTDAAGGNLAVLFNINLNHPIVIVVLGSTVNDRFKDVQTLYDKTREVYR